MSKDYLKSFGLKITVPRLQVLKVLEQTKKPHLSVEDIYLELLRTNNEASIATVYRVLTQFETAGLVIRHHFEEDYAVYELNQGSHHDHLVCTQCHNVEEFVDEAIENRQKSIAETKGFKMTSHSLNIYGICKPCRGKI